MLPSLENVFSSESLLQAMDVLLKLGIAVLLGGLIGYERESAGRAAGLRTHMLMCLGVTLICEVSKSFTESGDATRIASNVVTGVGFLGAGSILRMGVEIKGLTTAASMWATSAIGMAVSIGHGYYIVAIVATVLTLITLTVVDRLELSILRKRHPLEIVATVNDGAAMGRLLEELAAADIECARFDAVKLDDGHTALRIRLRGSGDNALQVAIGVPGVVSATWSEEGNAR